MDRSQLRHYWDDLFSRGVAVGLPISLPSGRVLYRGYEHLAVAGFVITINGSFADRGKCRWRFADTAAFSRLALSPPPGFSDHIATSSVAR